MKAPALDNAIAQFSHNYKLAFGPRLGAAYQINPKTVLRAGAGVMYGTTQTPQGLSYGVADYYTFNALGYGITPMPHGLQGPNPNPNLKYPNFSPGKYPIVSRRLAAAGKSRTSIYYPESRPPRILQWSIRVAARSAKRPRGGGYPTWGIVRSGGLRPSWIRSPPIR